MIKEGEWFAPDRIMGAKTMTTFKKTATAALPALTLSTAILVSAGSAEARSRFHRRHGIGLGIAGALAASSRSADAESAYDYDEPVRRCDMVERVNRFGEVVGYRKVCSLY